MINELRAFSQHGVHIDPNNKVGDEYITDCIFCEKENHFYINEKTKAWDCKKCGAQGGFQTFLNRVKNLSHDSFLESKNIMMTLSKDRGIKLNTLGAMKIGYNPFTNAYIIPVPYINDKEKLMDIRRYRIGRKTMTTSGCKVGLLGWDKLSKKPGDVWLCEGEWDYAAMLEVIQEEGLDDVVLSTPGAGTFKKEWIELFRDRKVNVVFDNDKAGAAGMERVSNALRGVANVHTIKWPEGKANGYDIRDLFLSCKNDYRTFISSARKYLNGSANKPLKKYNGSGIPYNQVYDTFRKWLYMPDTTALDIMYGMIIGNRLSGDPIWLLMVGPPGCLKSEPLLTLSGSPGIVARSLFTSKVLISGSIGAGGVDPSLIPLLNNGVLVMKDLTPMIEKPKEERDAVFGILRDAFDGEITRQVGSVLREYKSKFGILAGVTPAIDLVGLQSSSFGERFLRHSVWTARTEKEMNLLRDRVEGNVGKENEMKKELREVSKKVIDYNYGECIDLSKDVTDKIFYSSRFICQVRGAVSRNKFYPYEVIHKPFCEMPTRTYKQLMKLAWGICQFRKCSYNKDIHKIITGVAKDTVPSKLESFINILYKSRDNDKIDMKFLCNKMNLPLPTCTKAIEDLQMLKVVNSIKLSNIQKVYMLTNEIINIIEKGGIYDRFNNA